MTPEEAQDKHARKKIEREANYFACALLMPRDIFIAEFNKVKFDLGNDDALKILAEKFQVPITAVAFRIASLKL